MKKFLSIALVLVILCLSLCACGSKDANGNNDTVANEESKDNFEVETIDFTVENGSIKYLGFEKAHPDLCDGENVIVLKFEYVNKQSTPAQCQSTFYIQTFQNGVEIDDMPSYSSKGGDQYELVGNFYNEVMKDGKNTFGRIVPLKDDSPLTVMVKERNSSDSYQMMEIDVSAGSDVSGNADDTTTEKAESKVWKTDYYVDDFDQPTDEWYITNANFFSGSFDNSATTDSLLYVQVLVDCNKEIAFFLYEYGRNQVKNSSQYSVDTYDIVMRTADGKDQKIKGTVYCGGDRLIIDDQYRNTVLKALQGDGVVMFSVTNADRTVEKYLFKVETGNFKNEYSAKANG